MLILELENTVLRIFKSVLAYTGGLARFYLAKEQVESLRDRFSGSVHVYYSVYHAGVASLDLTPSYDFDVQKEFLFSRHKTRMRRLTPLGHREAIDKLHHLGTNEPYLARIGDFLNASIDLRENASYGPGFYISNVNLPSQLESHPVYSVSDLNMSADNPQPFTPLKEMIDKCVPEAEALLNEYPSYLCSWVEDRKEYQRLHAKMALTFALGQAPYYFGPNLPDGAFAKTKTKLRGLLKAMGPSYESEINPVFKLWDRQRYAEGLELGTKLTKGEMKVSDKPFS